MDVNTGAVLKTYPVQALGGIDVDDETGDLLVARNGTNQIFVQNRGPAPYDGSIGGLTVETDFAFPPFFVGDLAIEPLSCDVETVDRPGFQTASGHNWNMSVTVSDNDGIVLRDVRLGERYMAKEMSLPYYSLQTSALPLRRFQLKPDSTDDTARSRLVSFAINTDNEKLVVEATYAIDQIPASSQSCLFITQRYEFYKAIPEGGCEPSIQLPFHETPFPCTRFKPIVKYRFAGKGGDTLTKINIPQRHHFQVDSLPRNGSGIFRDCDNVILGCAGGIIYLSKTNPLPTEHFSGVIAGGIDSHLWDNYHQTFTRKVQEPGLIPPSGGCPECVHIHWRWGTVNGPTFGSGQPLIPPGSNQDVNFAAVRYHSGEEDPFTYIDLVNHENLHSRVTILDPEAREVELPEEVVFWYEASGYLNQDSFFTHGGFFNPAFRLGGDQSGPVAVKYFNLFAPGALTVDSIDPVIVGALPSGYTVYNNLAYDISTEAVVSGPHTVSINIPMATDPEVFASLRILHQEADPNDSDQMVLVDRTILAPDPLSADFGAKIVSARADSFSPFVIARVSEPVPPVSTATQFPAPNADDWNSGDVMVTINATDNSAVRQITYTNALTGATTTAFGSMASFTVTIEGGNEIIYYAIDKFGNVEVPKSIFVNIDRSPPFFLFIGTPSPEPNAAGWNNSDVSIDYAVDDNDGSGVFPSQRTLVLTNEGAAVTGTITITDRAGNSASETTGAVKIDKTRPVTTHNISLSGAQATVTLSTSDNLSGVATTSYSINGGASQSYSGPFTVNGAGSYTINYNSADAADNIEATKTASFTIASAPTTVTLVAIKDSFLRDGADDTNEGANERLRIQSSGHNRVLVAFDLSNISTANLVSATLVMSIGENSDNWGAGGQLVDVQRLLVDWTQGNGRNDVMVGGGPGFRGSGEGVTWNCAKDANISNQGADCLTRWNGGSFAAAAAPGVLHTNGLLGEARWDVTGDVQAGALFGWVIKKRMEGQSGQVRYYSLQGVGGDPTLAPRLVLVYSH